MATTFQKAPYSTRGYFGSVRTDRAGSRWSVNQRIKPIYLRIILKTLMYNTAFARIKCVIDGYLSSTASHIHNLVLVVNEELHLISIEKSVRAYSNLNFLLNLSGDPSKAYRIIKKLESMLAKINAAGLNNENEEFYFRLMHDAVVHNFKKDPSALLYLKQLISNISIVIKDDSQFSDFNYF